MHFYPLKALVYYGDRHIQTHHRTVLFPLSHLLEATVLESDGIGCTLRHLLCF